MQRQILVTGSFSFNRHAVSPVHNIPGFTLIELLIVVLIIGIVSSMAVLYIDTAHDRLKSEVQILTQMIAITRDQAILSGKPMAISFEPEQYAFSQWNGRKWQKLTTKPFKPVIIDPRFKLNFFKTAAPAVNRKKPQELTKRVYFLPSGEAESFVVELSNPGEEAYHVKVALMGEITVESSSED